MRLSFHSLGCCDESKYSLCSFRSFLTKHIFHLGELILVLLLSCLHQHCRANHWANKLGFKGLWIADIDRQLLEY